MSKAKATHGPLVAFQPTKSQHDELERLAKKTDRSKSAIIRLALEGYFALLKPNGKK